MASTMILRANVLDTEARLIDRGRNAIRTVATLHSDLQADEATLDSLCQFDALGALEHRRPVDHVLHRRASDVGELAGQTSMLG
jgi:hypothetical protein